MSKRTSIVIKARAPWLGSGFEIAANYAGLSGAISPNLPLQIMSFVLRQCTDDSNCVSSLS